ncbi:bifunctional phosphopantothenoylcysteine decarboxylase/phosphopantothenate--cysteine ligase CoaBC [bacterium]|nr:bifunctional phosphopantothenoylcysteine decarboxylase/phosphopantothenate--cysteine ligase CoaBC [bacterium]
MIVNSTHPGNILLGVTGGIAAYKSAEILRLLVKRGFDVKVVLTENGARFIGAETLAALSGHPVYSMMFAPSRNENIGHISLSDWADLFLVAPATANIIGKFASGIADDLLSTVFLSCECPILIAPAMNVRMFSHPVVQENIKKLRELGASFIGPESGELACGTSGKGRMSAPDAIVEATIAAMRCSRDLEGISFLISAGPTREMIDPIRFLSNRSSGRMGFAMARAAAARGARVTLLSGPTAIEPPSNVRLVRVVSAEEMRDEALSLLPDHQVIIMAAAVADYRPKQALSHKMKKDRGDVSLSLIRTPDILQEIGASASGKNVLVGFAAETNDLLENASRKLLKKRLDLIVANDVSDVGIGFEAEENAVTLVWPSGRTRKVGRMAKDALSDLILNDVLQIARDKLCL